MPSISDQIRSVGDLPLKDLLKYYGGWPALEKNWKKPDQRLEEMMGKMHGELNEHFLVSILVAPDDKNSSVNILVVSIIPPREIPILRRKLFVIKEYRLAVDCSRLSQLPLSTM